MWARLQADPRDLVKPAAVGALADCPAVFGVEQCDDVEGADVAPQQRLPDRPPVAGQEPGNEIILNRHSPDTGGFRLESRC
jgi:hypothetical protein